MVIPVGDPTEVRIGVALPRAKLWVRRDVEWVPTVTNGPCKINYLQLTNICDREMLLRWGTTLELWMVADTIPRSQGYVSVESRRYNEWQNLAFKATTDREKSHLKRMKTHWWIGDHILRRERYSSDKRGRQTRRKRPHS